MTFLLLLACKTVTSTAEPVPTVAVEAAVVGAQQVTPAPTVAPKPMPLLTLNPVDLRVDQAKGKLIYSPGSMVQSASYTQYWMDLDAALATLGGMPESEVSVRFQVVETKTRTVTPEPNMPSPDGGIEITEHHGFLVLPPGAAKPKTY
ncbi:MAG: hypothetical protein ACI9VR_005282 [Cognaticolwellia sp.]|jgi:hypothetical protein